MRECSEADFPERHGVGDASPLPEEPLPSDLIPGEVLDDYYLLDRPTYRRVGGELASSTGYYVRVLGTDFDDTSFSRWIIRIGDGELASSVAEALRRVYDLNSEPHPTRFESVPGDGMDRIGRLLADREIAASPPSDYFRAIRIEAASLLRDLERDAATARQQAVEEQASTRPPDADATEVIDVAMQALMLLIDRCDGYERGRASRELKDAAHRAYQSAAADVLAEYGTQATFDPFDDTLDNVRLAAGGAGRTIGPSSTKTRAAAASELANLRFAALTRARDRAAAAAKQIVMPFAAGPRAASPPPPANGVPSKEVPDAAPPAAGQTAGAADGLDSPPTTDELRAPPLPLPLPLTTDQKIMLAIAELERDPSQPQKVIAATVGVSPSTLSESTRFQAAKRALAGRAPPIGIRRDDGSVEATDNADDDAAA